MAIIVEHIESKNKYVLLGSSFSYFKEISDHAYLKFLRNKEEGEFEVISICDENGNIIFSNAEEFRVIEVDGNLISEIFSRLK